MAKLLFLSGSARKDSINQKMATAAAHIAADLGAEITLISLKDYILPLYDGDLEMDQGLPEAAIKLKQLFTDHDGFFIASPEYNSAYSALLKNTIDWLSRPHTENEAYLSAFNGKVAAIGAMSPGALGGLRGLTPLRMLLGNINIHVIPSQTALQSQPETFDENHRLANPQQEKMLKNTIAELIKTADALR